MTPRPGSDPARARRPRRALGRRRVPLLLVGLLLLAAGCGATFDPSTVEGPPADPRSVQAAAARPPAADVEAPIALAIPAIDVRTPLIELGLEPDRTVEVPEDPLLAGWYTGSPRPGAIGPATIVGHVDSSDGAGIFHRLHELQPGALIGVQRADRTVARFRVDRVERHPKDDFPSARVYGDTPAPELRIITCGGSFDRRARSYSDNVVVFARLAER
jgi:sortase (surface protein transpeptidase)